MPNVTFTLFADLSAKEPVEYTTTAKGFSDWLRALPEYASKAACPLISLNRYSGERTEKDSARSNASIVEVWGAIGDYDAGDMAPDTAAAILKSAGVQAYIVTTPSHGTKGNRWRVILPFSKAGNLEDRHALLGKANTLLGGVLAGESFTASQAFYVGRVVGVPYSVTDVEGVAIDTMPGIESIPVSGPERVSRAAAPHDPFMLAHKRATGGTEQIRAALALIPNDEPDWERWNRIGMAVYNASGGSDEGREAWREWSDQCMGAEGDSVDARWRHYGSSPPTELGMGTLVHLSGGLALPVAEVRQVEGEPEPESLIPEILSGFQFLAITQQVEYFAGCVYVQDLHRVFTPKGTLLKPEQFRATFGGYLFAIDAGNDKVTKNAWEAFTESQGVRYPIADSIAFRPEKAPGALIHEGDRVLVNTYTPAKVSRVKGDVGPFLRHLKKILPDQHDRAILLAYMAACVQRIGSKFQWAPLLQGTEGNGKTLFTRCVAYAIGDKYVHLPPAHEISEKFNSWLFNTLFIGVEDIYVPEQRREIIEVLKPYITSDRLAKRAMHSDQTMGDVRCNFMFNSNHLDAVRKTNNDRRFCVFYTAQQSKADLARDGMDGDYFPDLYDWLKGKGRYEGQPSGYSVVAEFLHTYDIPRELDPSDHCHTAPITSTTEQAIANGLGSVEQEILEAVEEGRAGFAGGWISSIALDRLLEARRMSKAIPPNKRRGMLQGLGYDWHPSLESGRVNNPTAIDGGGKPRLFIKRGHKDIEIQRPAEVAKAYQEAQRSRMAETVFGKDAQGS